MPRWRLRFNGEEDVRKALPGTLGREFQARSSVIARLFSLSAIPKKGVYLVSFAKYVFSEKAAWYWTTITVAIATLIAAFVIPENAYPIVYIRYVLSSIFVLWLPGYTFIKALYPTKVQIKTPSEIPDTIERVALSSGMSLALVLIVGLLLNYTPWGIRLTPIVLSLLSLTTIFATVAIIREHETATLESRNKNA